MIIRAYELKKGDVFERHGVRYKVIFVNDKVIHYSLISYLNHQGRWSEMGRRSQERVVLINGEGSIQY